MRSGSRRNQRYDSRAPAEGHTESDDKSIARDAAFSRAPQCALPHGGLEYNGCFIHPYVRHIGEHVPIEVYGSTLPCGIGAVFHKRLDEAPALVRDEQLNASTAALEYDAVEIYVWERSFYRSGFPEVDLVMQFLVELRYAPGRDLGSLHASVMSSTRRTDTPAGYISMSPSSRPSP